MTLKTFAAPVVAATFCFVPLGAQAHEGHHHPAKTEKTKKTKVPKKSGLDIRFVMRSTVA